MTTANGYTARPTGTGGEPGQRDLVLSSVGNQANVRKSGMVFPRNLPERSWERIGTSLRELTNSSAWWLGDWLVFGESTYGLRRYREAIERTGLDYQTLRNYAWVARRFEQHRRRDGLSFAHHAEVTRLSPPEQDHWLDRAEQRKWSRNELRRAVRAGLAEQGHRTGLPRAAATTSERRPSRTSRWTTGRWTPGRGTPTRAGGKTPHSPSSCPPGNWTPTRKRLPRTVCPSPRG